MNEKNYLILFIIVGMLIFSYCFDKRENMGSVKGKIFLKGQKIHKVFDLRSYPLVDTKTLIKVNKLKEDDYIIQRKKIGRLWEGKTVPVEKILDVLNEGLKECDITDLKLQVKDVNKFKNRKTFVKLVPLLKKKFRSEINYNNVRCFVSKFEPDNYININKTQDYLPKFLANNNSMIVNQHLYHFSPFGVLKYKLKSNLPINEENQIINATFEATIFNDINFHNNSSHIIIPYEGNLYQIKNNKFFNLQTEEVLNVKKLLEKNIIDDENHLSNINKQIITSNSPGSSVSEQSNKIIYLINYAEKLFIVKHKMIVPNIGIGKEINDNLKKNKITILGVIPHFFYEKDKLQARFLFLCNNNFYFYVSDDKVSKLKDFKKDYGFKYSKKMEYKLSCDEHKVILDQLVKANKISEDRKVAIMKNLKCN